MRKPGSKPRQVEHESEAQALRIPKGAYEALLHHGLYDPERPMAYLDYVRRTGNKSRRPIL